MIAVMSTEIPAMVDGSEITEWSDTADVLVVGFGVAGACAAIAAGVEVLAAGGYVMNKEMLAAHTPRLTVGMGSTRYPVRRRNQHRERGRRAVRRRGLLPRPPWYEQFYVDVADVTEDMTARFEFEVDTTHANEVWQAEVAANLERRKS